MSIATNLGIECIRVKVGTKFRPDNPTHVDKVLTKIATEHGEGFELDGYEPADAPSVGESLRELAQAGRASGEFGQVNAGGSATRHECGDARPRPQK